MIVCNLCNENFKTYKDLTKHLVREHKFSVQDVYNYYEFTFNVEDEQVCPICGSSFKLNLRQIKDINSKSKCVGCNSSCSKSLVHIIHGSSLAKKEVREKIKKTNLEKYGSENVLSNKEVRNKIAATNLGKYGVENIGSVKEVQDKIKNTNLERYGVRSTLSLDDVKDKIKHTNIEKYGVEFAISSKEVQDKIKKTNLERYGTGCCLSNKEVQDRVRNTCLERYGVENPMQALPTQNKMRETCLKKYGVPSPLESEEIQNKIKNTCLERYGTDKVSSLNEVKEKVRKTNLEKYGVEYFCQHERCNFPNGKRISKLNRKFHEILLEFNIENELEFVIDKSGYDIRAGNTLLELNPWYTHNSTFGPSFHGGQGESKPANYHKNKSKVAMDNGYSCIHIFDWDDEQKVINLLLPKVKVPARKCKVKKLNTDETNSFLSSFHLQGYTKTFLYSYGLVFNDELIEVMTFGKPRYNRNYEYELLRLCSHKDYKVIGGANKLLSAFEKEVKVKSLISYCDLSKFSGDVYLNLGFKLKAISSPSKHWYNIKTGVHYTDNFLRQRGFDQLHGTNYGKGTSNELLMLENNYVEIFDCGQATYIKFYS